MNFHVFLYDLTTVWVAVIMCVVATVSKFIPAWLAQKNFRFTTSERTLIFGLSNAQAAATLAAVLSDITLFWEQLRKENRFVY